MTQEVSHDIYGELFVFSASVPLIYLFNRFVVVLIFPSVL